MNWSCWSADTVVVHGHIKTFNYRANYSRHGLDQFAFRSCPFRGGRGVHHWEKKHATSVKSLFPLKLAWCEPVHKLHNVIFKALSSSASLEWVRWYSNGSNLRVMLAIWEADTFIRRSQIRSFNRPPAKLPLLYEGSQHRLNNVATILMHQINGRRSPKSWVVLFE